MIKSLLYSITVIIIALSGLNLYSSIGPQSIKYQKDNIFLIDTKVTAYLYQDFAIYDEIYSLKNIANFNIKSFIVIPTDNYPNTERIKINNYLNRLEIKINGKRLENVQKTTDFSIGSFYCFPINFNSGEKTEIRVRYWTPLPQNENTKSLFFLRHPYFKWNSSLNNETIKMIIKEDDIKTNNSFYTNIPPSEIDDENNIVIWNINNSNKVERDIFVIMKNISDSNESNEFIEENAEKESDTINEEKNENETEENSLPDKEAEEESDDEDDQLTFKDLDDKKEIIDQINKKNKNEIIIDDKEWDEMLDRVNVAYNDIFPDEYTTSEKDEQTVNSKWQFFPFIH